MVRMLINPVKQCKGTDYYNIINYDAKERLWFYSIKYDGHYCQIYYLGKQGHICYTSGEKPFYLDDNFQNQLQELFGLVGEFGEYNIENPLILEAEFIGKSQGKLGDRTKCGLLTTFRTNTAKGIPNKLEPGNKFMIFDVIDSDRFSHRLNFLLNRNLPHTDNIYFVEYTAVNISQQNLNSLLRDLPDGYEGFYVKQEEHDYVPGKRVRNAIKVKKRKTADLLCVNFTEGKGKYVGMIGSLVLRDSQGRVVEVGSGLTDADRSLNPAEFVDKVVEIGYEQILDTYIQPTFITVRGDKDASAIN